MKQKTKLKKGFALNLCFATLAGLGLSFVVSFLGAWIAMKSSDPLSHTSTVALAALVCGGFTCSFVGGKRGKGAGSGLVCGACFLLLLVFASLFGSGAKTSWRIALFASTATAVLLGAFLSSRKGNNGKKRLKKLGVKR